jgi:hypothetical protein
MANRKWLAILVIVLTDCAIKKKKKVQYHCFERIRDSTEGGDIICFLVHFHLQ